MSGAASPQGAEILTAKKKSQCASTVFTADPGNITVTSNRHRTTVYVKVNGTPRPQYRVHGYAKKTGGIKVFTPSSANQKSFRAAVSSALNKYQRRHNLSPLFNTKLDAPIEIKLIFHFKRPKSHYVDGCLLLDAPTFVTKVPDLDNIVKLVLDSLQGVVYTNDSVVSSIGCKKVWSDHRDVEEFTAVTITQFKDRTVYDPSCGCEQCVRKETKGRTTIRPVSYV
jgi:Holliday junction resolvase RusA-like endonuclease